MSDTVERLMEIQCEACQAPLDESQRCTHCGADNTQGPLLYRFMSASIFAECPACKHRIPVNGALRMAHCDQCMTDMDLVHHWKSLSDTFKGLFRFERHFGSLAHDSGEFQYKLKLEAPICGKCKQPLPAARISVKTDGPYPCPACKAPVTVFPTPPWLKEVFPKAEQFFDAERATDAPEDQPAVSPAQEIKPIFFQCPGCGGNLTITQDSERTITCEYCEASAYLPDPLWRQLHPVRTAKPWSIRIRAPKPKGKK